MPRPLKTFNEFIGQRNIINLLKKLIKGALELGTACPSMLFMAKPGDGKTTLAHALAFEYGSTLHNIYSGKDISPKNLSELLQRIEHGDILIFDEVQSLKNDTQQILHIAWDFNKVPAQTKDNTIDRTKFKSVAEFTMILCTTQPGKVNAALRSRLINIEFEPYKNEELKVIARAIAKKKGINLTGQAANLLANVSQGSPRLIQRRLETLWTYWSTVKMFTQAHVQELLEHEGVDQYGLTSFQRRYLNYLHENPRNTCTLERLSIKIGCDKEYLKSDVEPFLIEKGYINPYSARGRSLTRDGLELIKTHLFQNIENKNHPEGA